MIERSFDAAFVNKIANHPEIHPWISGSINEPLDVSKIVENKDNVSMMGEYGGFVFINMGKGIFDAHSMVLPEGRGAWAMNAAKEALKWIFSKGAREVLMTVPEGNIAVRALVKRLKAKFKHREEEVWWRDGRRVPADIYSLTYEDWKLCR